MSRQLYLHRIFQGACLLLCFLNPAPMAQPTPSQATTTTISSDEHALVDLPVLDGLFIEEWIRAHRFEDLEKKLALLERVKGKDGYGRTLLDKAASEYLRAWDLEPHFDAYLKRYPRSYWAHYFKAKWYSGSAWSMKDGLWGWTLTEEESKIYQQKMKQAGTYYFRALAIRQDEVNVYLALIDFMKLMGIRDEQNMQRLYLQAHQLRADSYDVARYKLAWLSPYWGGSVQGFLDYANACATPDQPDPVRLVYMGAYDTLTHDFSKATSSALFWKQAQEIYERLLKNTPDWEILNEYAKLALDHDKAQAQEIFKRIGSHWSPKTWNNLNDYLNQWEEAGIDFNKQAQTLPGGDRFYVFGGKMNKTFVHECEHRLAKLPGYRTCNDKAQFLALPLVHQRELADAMLDRQLAIARLVPDSQKPLVQWLRDEAQKQGYPYVEKSGELALSYRPDDWELAQKAFLNFRSNNQPLGDAAMRAFLERHPYHLEALRTLAEDFSSFSLDKPHDKPELHRIYSEHLLQINPTPTAARFRCAYLISTHQATETLQLAERFLRITPQEFHAMSKTEYAEHLSDRDLDGFLELLEYRAQALQELGRNEEAVEDFKTVKRLAYFRAYSQSYFEKALAQTSRKQSK